MSEGKMSDLELQVWFALRDLEKRFTLLLAQVPADPTRAELWGDYEDARVELDEPIGKLRAAISAAFGQDHDALGDLAKRVFCAILVHYDERELAHQGEDEAHPKRVLLQAEYCGIYDGGERFVEFLQDALRASSTPVPVLELLLFCLRSGFCGRFSGPEDEERQARLKELIERVDRAGPQIPQQVVTASAVRAIEGAGFPFGYYLAALGMVMALWLVLQLAARTHERHLLGSEQCELK